MGLIDSEKAIKALTHWETEATDEEIIYTINNLPTVEAIPKADYENRLATDMATIKQLSNSVKTLQKANLEIAGAYGKLETNYENRLKADMVDMLTELLLEIEQCGVEDSHWIIKEKINALKGKEDGKDN